MSDLVDAPASPHSPRDLGAEQPTNTDVIEQPPSLKRPNAEPVERACKIQKPNSTFTMADIVDAPVSSQSSDNLRAEEPTNTDVFQEPPSLKRPNVNHADRASKIQKRDLKELTDRKTKLAKDLSMLCYHKEHLQSPNVAEQVEQCRIEMEAVDSEIKIFHVENIEKVGRYIGTLAHACQCSDSPCRYMYCNWMKPIIQHTKDCMNRKNGTCPVCQQFVAVCGFHATDCTLDDCIIPYCEDIRQENSKGMVATELREDPKSQQGPHNKPVSLPKLSNDKGAARCVASVAHACQCSDAGCTYMSCHKMKRVIKHANKCKKRENGTCPVCRQFIAICGHHASDCTLDDCIIPFCKDIRQKSAEGMATTGPIIGVRTAVP